MSADPEYSNEPGEWAYQGSCDDQEVIHQRNELAHEAIAYEDDDHPQYDYYLHEIADRRDNPHGNPDQTGLFFRPSFKADRPQVAWGPDWLGHQGHQHHACDKSTDVGPPGDPSRFQAWCTERGDAVEKLADEPETDHDQRRYVNDREEEEEGKNNRDSGAGVGDHVCAEDACDRPARTNGWNGRVGCDQDLGKVSDDAARQVEEHVPQVAETVLNVVTEDPQKEHVAAEVEPAAVEEHCRDQRDQCGCCSRRASQGGRYARRNNPPALDERVEVPSETQLVEEDKDIDADQREINGWGQPGSRAVLQR